MTEKKRLAPEARSDLIVDAALRLAKRKGFRALTRDAVADEAQVSAGLINYSFGTVTKLRAAVMRRAISDEVLPIIAAGIAEKHPATRNLSAELKQRAILSMA